MLAEVLDPELYDTVRIANLAQAELGRSVWPSTVAAILRIALRDHDESQP